MKKTLISLGSAMILGLPALVFAATEFDTGYVDSLIKGGSNILKDLLLFLISLAVVWFIWNVVRYSMADDEEKKGKAKEQMISGIIAITVIVAIWGIVSILVSMFFGGSGANGSAPQNLDSMIPTVK